MSGCDTMCLMWRLRCNTLWFSWDKALEGHNTFSSGQDRCHYSTFSASQKSQYYSGISPFNGIGYDEWGTVGTFSPEWRNFNIQAWRVGWIPTLWKTKSRLKSRQLSKRLLLEQSQGLSLPVIIDKIGGADETRTRDLRRDRPAF